MKPPARPAMQVNLHAARTHLQRAFEDEISAMFDLGPASVAEPQ
jgi:hypothetical protein